MAGQDPPYGVDSRSRIDQFRVAVAEFVCCIKMAFNPNVSSDHSVALNISIEGNNIVFVIVVAGMH